MNRCVQLFFIRTALLCLSISLFSCGPIARKAIARGANGKTAVDIKIDSAAIFPEMIQIRGSLYDFTYPDEPLIFASIEVWQDGMRVAGTETDFDGDFSIILPLKDLATSALNLRLSYLGYPSLWIENMPIRGGDVVHILALLEPAVNPNKQQWNFYRVPLIQLDETTSGQTFTSEQIRSSPTRGR